LRGECQDRAFAGREDGMVVGVAVPDRGGQAALGVRGEHGFAARDCDIASPNVAGSMSLDR
jgi:hypothetical protein